MNVETLLSHLRKVRPTASGEWVACCPAHEDRSPSLSVKDAGDGRILLHCFAECSVENIVGALGLTLSDLMPDRPLGHVLKRVPFNPRTVLEAIAFQATVTSIAAADLSKGNPMSVADRDLLWDASRQIQNAVEYVTR